MGGDYLIEKPVTARARVCVCVEFKCREEWASGLAWWWWKMKPCFERTHSHLSALFRSPNLSIM